jgi:hypothetical protein
MPDINFIRREIERMRTQVHQQRSEIRQLQRAGVPTTAAEALLDRMLNKIDELCAERDRLKREQPSPSKGKVLGGHLEAVAMPTRQRWIGRCRTAFDAA